MKPIAFAAPLAALLLAACGATSPGQLRETGGRTLPVSSDKSVESVLACVTPLYGELVGSEQVERRSVPGGYELLERGGLNDGFIFSGLRVSEQDGSTMIRGYAANDRADRSQRIEALQTLAQRCA